MEQELVKSPIGELEIRQRIRTIRGVQVMLDRDLAELYGVETKAQTKPSSVTLIGFRRILWFSSRRKSV